MNYQKGIVTMIFGALLVSSVGASLSHATVTGQDVRDNVVPGQYIVVLKDSVPDSDATAGDMGKKHGLGIGHTYSHAVKGFSATIPASQLNAVTRDPRVAYVSEDRMVYANGAAGRAGPPVAPEVVPTGVRRIDAPANANTGAGIGVAVIDTGIDLTHPDLVGNISPVNKTCVAGTKNATDDNGHGTHVAGTIAATDNDRGVVGVAPGATLYAVKVLNRRGAGQWSDVICGIDWVTAHADEIKVANMSLGGAGTTDTSCGADTNDALHQAICRSRDAGVTYVVAAGNNGADVTGLGVPAGYDDAVITVSALADSDGTPGGFGPLTAYGEDDTFASFSNYGVVVDIGAPGVDILSTTKGGGYGLNSGTSMATPHVSGAVAVYLQSHTVHAGPVWSEVRDALVASGEVVDGGHRDPSQKHPEVVLRAGTL